jgi:hypothetical protein
LSLNSKITPIENGVMMERPLAGHTLRILATNLRATATGVHAKLRVYDDKTLLAWTTTNIERAEQRTRLAGEAHAGLLPDNIAPDGEKYALSDLKFDLGMFCSEAWDVYLGNTAPIAVVGDAMKSQGWLATPHVVLGGGTILFGPPGSTKSYTALLMAVSIDAGINGLWGTTQANSLYVNLERGAGSMERRLGVVNGVLGLSPDRPLYMLNRRGSSLEDVQEVVSSFVKKKNIGFVVLDSITRAGGDLIEGKTANAIMDKLNDSTGSWLAIGHSPRGDSSHIYGSVFFDAAADLILRQSAHTVDPTTIGVQILGTKANDVAKPPPMYLTYTFDEWGLKGVEKAKEGDYPELASTKDISIVEEVESVLFERGTATATEVAQLIGKPRAQVLSVLRDSPKFIWVKKENGQGHYAASAIGLEND